VSRLSSKSVSELLAEWRAGDEEALQALVPLVYNELRRIAHRYLQKELRDHTLQSAADEVKQDLAAYEVAGAKA